MNYQKLMLTNNFNHFNHSQKYEVIFNLISTTISFPISFMLAEQKLRLVITLIAIIPFCYLMSKMKNSTTKILLSIFLTIIAQIYVFRMQVICLWFQQILVYCICRWGPRKHLGKIIFIQSFIFLFAIMGRRMYYYYGLSNFDITAPVCMQTFVYIGFAFNYQKGLNKDSEQQSRMFGGHVQHSRHIYEFPDLLHYVGFMMFLPASLVGPVYQYQDFYHWAQGTSVYSTMPDTKQAILKQGKTFIICAIIYLATIPLTIQFVLTQQYANWPALYQIGYFTIMILAQRFQYYIAWCIGMLGVNATGITYNPIGGKNNWDRITVSDIKTFQLDPSFKKRAQAWNKSVQVALRRYVYENIMTELPKDCTQSQRRSKVSQAQLKTLIVSAFWHGFYPGYLISFFHWFLMMEIDQQIFRLSSKNQKFFIFKKKYLDWIYILILNFFVSYFGACFLLMSFEKISFFMATLNYVPVLLVYLGNIMLVRLKLLQKVVNLCFPQHSHSKSAKHEVSQKSEQNTTVNHKKDN